MTFDGYDARWDSGSTRHPAVITEAGESFEEQHRARVRRYTILMAFRIPALVLSGILYSALGNAWVSLAVIGVSIPLPWIAVLVANDRPARRKDEPRRYNGGPMPIPHRPSLEAEHHFTVDG